MLRKKCGCERGYRCCCNLVEQELGTYDTVTEMKKSASIKIMEGLKMFLWDDSSFTYEKEF